MSALEFHKLWILDEGEGVDGEEFVAHLSRGEVR